MKIETQIGIILGIVILIIICVFLNKGMNVKEPKLSPLALPKGSTQHHEIEEIKLEVLKEKKLGNSRIIEKPQIVAETLYEEEEETLPEDVQQVASVDISTKTIHKVKPNDSLFKIANKYFGDGTKWNKIFEANKDSMSDPHSLYVGQELLIPELSD
ncbi:MAG: LysM peptidoglycan-binding domain-containing protein [Planctomycetota bacterium]